MLVFQPAPCSIVLHLKVTRFFFRIVSNLFESNKDFGEEALVQREFFTGRPFDKQFACKFIGRRSPEQSIIGKIYIERVHDNSEIEPLFDFVLTKVSVAFYSAANFLQPDMPKT